MNRQIIYIINAFLILLFLIFVYFIVQQLFFKPSSQPIYNKQQIDFISSEKELPLSGVMLDGQNLFKGKCAPCHNIFKDMTGPALNGFEERGPWSDRKHVYEWIRNPQKFAVSNKYAKDLIKKYISIMPSFLTLTDEEIDAICLFIRNYEMIRSEVIVD